MRLDAINRADIAEVASRQPAATFPAVMGIVRVQAPAYRSYTYMGESPKAGRFEVLATQELLTDVQLEGMARWPGVAAAVPVGRLLLPDNLESIDDLRLAAARIQADVVMVYTIDTTFQVRGRSYGPLALISLGMAPDRDAHVASTASAVFTDVRTGYTYGVAEATVRASGLTSMWGTNEMVDRKRLEAEQAAFDQLLVEAARNWGAIQARMR